MTWVGEWWVLHIWIQEPAYCNGLFISRWVKTLGRPLSISKERPHVNSPIPIFCLQNIFLNLLCPLISLDKIFDLSKQLSVSPASELQPTLNGPADKPPKISNLQGKTFPDKPHHDALTLPHPVLCSCVDSSLKTNKQNKNKNLLLAWLWRH